MFCFLVERVRTQWFSEIPNCGLLRLSLGPIINSLKNEVKKIFTLKINIQQNILNTIIHERLRLQSLKKCWLRLQWILRNGSASKDFLKTAPAPEILKMVTPTPMNCNERLRLQEFSKTSPAPRIFKKTAPVECNIRLQ